MSSSEESYRRRLTLRLVTETADRLDQQALENGVTVNSLAESTFDVLLEMRPNDVIRIRDLRSDIVRRARGTDKDRRTRRPA